MQAAAAAGQRIERALEILGADAPESLAMAGRLRIAHPLVSLAELGQLADPPLSKDAIASQIRRLLATADGRDGDLGMTAAGAWRRPRCTRGGPRVSRVSSIGSLG